MQCPAAALALLLVPLALAPAAHAEINAQSGSTDQGTLGIDFYTVPDEIGVGEEAKIKIDFINPVSQKIQEHIDYRLTVSRDGEAVFGPIALTHTSTGSVTIPVEFAEGGMYEAAIEVEGILFQPIPAETASFSVAVGGAAAASAAEEAEPEGDGGGCLIATAAHGSELAPQVQRLREVRDTVVMGTHSGAAFMAAFNQAYYAFSPAVADLERGSPEFREAVRVALAPMLAALSVLAHAGIDSEAEMIAYGIGAMLMAAAAYALPALAALWACRRWRGLPGRWARRVRPEAALCAAARVARAR